MSDFHQNGIVTVLHRLGPANLDRIEADLVRHAVLNPIALVLPALYAEIERPALRTFSKHSRPFHTSTKSSSPSIGRPLWSSALPRNTSAACPSESGSSGTTGRAFRTF